MAHGRLELQALLETLGALETYFQPPSTISMVYPCIVYELGQIDSKFANNILYKGTKRYQVTVIALDPDSQIPDKVASLPMSLFNRFFRADNLNHFVFDLYF